MTPDSFAAKARDPLIDPKPGDEVIFGPQWQRELYTIIEVNGKRISYQMGPMRAVLQCTLDQWREWCKSAGEVIHAAD